jgi:hypothetical protein
MILLSELLNETLILLSELSKVNLGPLSSHKLTVLSIAALFVLFFDLS